MGSFNGRYHFQMRKNCPLLPRRLETGLALVSSKGEPATQNARRGVTPIALRTFKRHAIFCSEAPDGDGGSMAKAIEDLGGVLVGHLTLMQWGQGVATPGQALHDGDTMGSDPKGNLSVRFLGVDAPKISFTLPTGGAEEFADLGDPRWEVFLADAFAPGLPAFQIVGSSSAPTGAGPLRPLQQIQARTERRRYI